jgi:hypothetical protein
MASLSSFWAVSRPGGGWKQPRPIAILQPYLGARAPVHGQPNIPTGLVGALGTRDLRSSVLRRQRGPIRSHCAVAATSGVP